MGRGALWGISAVAVVPVVAALVASWLGAGPAGAGGHTFSAAVDDTAFVLLLTVSLLLLIRWRLTGDAMAVCFAAMAGLTGVLLVPAVSHLGHRAASAYRPSYTAALLITAVPVVLAISFRAMRGPEVRAGLRPVVLMGSSAAAATLPALVVAFSPASIVVSFRPGGVGVAYLLEAAAGAPIAILLLIEGLRRGRVLLVGSAAAVLSVAGMCGSLGSGTALGTGTWSSLPGLFLLVGALELIVVVTGELGSAISAVVLHDVRGRRRWEAAETELTKVRTTYEGQDHDITSMLSAVDGTLFVLSTQRDRIPGQEVDRLMMAVRDQIENVRNLLAKQEREREAYDLSELIENLVALRSCEEHRVTCELEAGVLARGRPDRITLVVNNLLANATTHAPGANVKVIVKRVVHDHPQKVRELASAVEITICDDGPGMSDEGLSRAFDRGWRGNIGAERPGSGLGLFQCRELLSTEDGTIVLAHADPSAETGRRGLEVRIRIPASASTQGLSPLQR